MKKLKVKVVDGRTFTPCYVVNDWGVDGWFLGTDYKCTAYGTHSIDMQTDRRITKSFKADVLWPDGSISSEKVILLRTDTETVHDMGHSYNVETPVYGVRAKVRGVETEVLADKLYFDLATIGAG